ncbi:hypothetical protein CPB85DRAFT_1436370 [Mucidula mucida]|nr:hypothetical protein CPB85DRAFT_1436370 [Mucidula mucida]
MSGLSLLIKNQEAEEEAEHENDTDVIHNAIREHAPMMKAVTTNRADLQYVFDYARALDGGTQYHIHYMFAHGTTLNGWHTS